MENWSHCRGSVVACPALLYTLRGDYEYHLLSWLLQPVRRLLTGVLQLADAGHQLDVQHGQVQLGFFKHPAMRECCVLAANGCFTFH